MQRLSRQVAVCPLCRELVRSRTAPVFGKGKLGAKVFMVGEAPGREEDARGEPFVGQAGKLLDELLAEVGLARGDVFLTNVIKCHPPGNRTPRSHEITNCFPYLEQQIALVEPLVICTLGRVAACALLKSKQRLERMRCKTNEYEGIPVFCSYHPAFVRRTPAMRAAAVADLRRVRECIDSRAE